MNKNKLFFTSDQHYGHANIIKYCNRPFADIHEMRETLIENYNKVVGPNDTCIHVGDTFFYYTELEMSSLLSRLNGQKILVRGNHDGGPEKMRKGGFDLVMESFIFLYDNFQFNVQHFPYRNDSPYDEKFAAHRPKDDGKWLIHGHVHDRWKKKGRMLNVSVEVWDYKPVSIEQLIDLARNKISLPTGKR